MKVKLTLIAISLGLITTSSYAHKADDIIVRGGAIYVHPKKDSESVKLNGAATDLKAKADNDTQLGLNFQYMVTDHIGIELLAATPFSHKLSLGGGNSTGLAGKSLGKIKHLPPTLSLVWYPLDSNNKLQPYVGAGVNYTFFFDEKLSGEAKDAGFERGLDLDSSWGWAAQVGMDYSLSDNWLINAQARYIKIETDATTYLAGNKITAKYKLDPWVAMVSIGYRF